MGIDFVECHHDSAMHKQVWFALAALAILFIPFCASMGEEQKSGVKAQGVSSILTQMENRTVSLLRL